MVENKLMFMSVSFFFDQLTRRCPQIRNQCKKELLEHNASAKHPNKREKNHSSQFCLMISYDAKTASHNPITQGTLTTTKNARLGVVSVCGEATKSLD